MENIQILNQVKQNKKYKTLSDELILSEIKEYLNKNNPKKIIKQDIKHIRSKLHRAYSTYQTTKKNKIQLLLNQLKQNPESLDIINKILSSNISTKERLDDYKFIYNKIFQITDKPKSIIDLGCGLNPISFPYMNLQSLIYYAYDIDEQDIKFLNEFFNIMKNKIKGKAEILNLRDFKKISNLPPSDIIFLWKIIDLIDIDNHKPSEELINFLFNKNKAKFIVASFATKTITRKQMNFPKRKWFEFMLKRNNLDFKTFQTKNEIFYIISRI